jgi:hypothetical protein
MERLKTLEVESNIPAGTIPEEIAGQVKLLPCKAVSRQNPSREGKHSNKLSK